jgi:hypothetical protein
LALGIAEGWLLGFAEGLTLTSNLQVVIFSVSDSMMVAFLTLSL